MYCATEAAENHFGPYFRHLALAIRVSKGIPVSKCTMKGFDELSGGLEPASGNSHLIINYKIE